jgi:two-component system, cell cycle sensor histidine kinase and response regulator CckA
LASKDLPIVRVEAERDIMTEKTTAVLDSASDDDHVETRLDELRHDQSIHQERLLETERALTASEQRYQQLVAQQEVLRASEQAYRELFDAGGDAVFVHELKPDGTPGRFLQVNETACRALGYTREELLAMTPAGINAPWSDPELESIKARFRAGQPATFERVHISRSGQRISVEIRTRMFTFRGAPAVIALVRDITERRRSEDEKDRLQAQLLQSQKMEAIGRLAGGVAHDFNNLLTGILAYSELARDELDPSSEVAEYLLGIKEAVKQCSALTAQILAFSRKQMLTIEIVDVNALILSAGRMLRRIIGEDVEIMTMLQPDLARVRADNAQLQQILVNLAVNARDAMPHGGILTVETTNAVVSDPAVQESCEICGGDCVVISVSDTGHGMDGETLSHVFEPFFTTKQLGRGTGLGLATVYGIVKQHGGHIDVRSTPGAGTVFRVFLPSVREEADIEPVFEPPTVARGSETILVVEDEPLVRELTVRHLSNCGYAVLSAPGPVQALALLRQYDGPIAILVTDVVMPVMNGRELYAKAVAERPNLKVLYMSGYPGDALAEHGGAPVLGLGFIQKPFGVVELTRQIRRILDHEATSQVPTT